MHFKEKLLSKSCIIIVFLPLFASFKSTEWRRGVNSCMCMALAHSPIPFWTSALGQWLEASPAQNGAARGDAKRGVLQGALPWHARSLLYGTISGNGSKMETHDGSSTSCWPLPSVVFPALRPKTDRSCYLHLGYILFAMQQCRTALLWQLTILWHCPSICSRPQSGLWINRPWFVIC